MRLSITFSAYVGRQFLFWFFSVTLILVVIILLFDLVELIRRTSGREGATFGIALFMAFLKMPSMIEKAIPFAMLFGSMFAFWRLNRSQELVVARASGVSVWQLLLPVILLAVVIGSFKVAVFNSLSSAMLLRYEQLKAKHIRGKSSLAAVSDDGLWLRQATKAGHYVLHARQVTPHKMRLDDVIILMLEGTDKFVGRIDASHARLRKGRWVLTGARLTPSEGAPRYLPYHEIETDLTPENIQDSFAPPETLSFWALPRFISVLEAAGFRVVIPESRLCCGRPLISKGFLKQAKENKVALIPQVMDDVDRWMKETDPEHMLAFIPTPPVKKFLAALKSGKVDDATVRAALVEKNLFEGRALYAMNCRPCHGDSVAGDGPMADGFKLRPINFTDNGTIETIVEGYTFWRVSNGGPGLPTEATPWDSAMPEWKLNLTEEQRWKIIMAEYDLAQKTPRIPETH